MKPKEILKNDELEIRRHNGSRYWESLYMQNPVPDEGILKVMVRIWDEVDPPHCDFIIQTLDTAFLHEQRQTSVLYKHGVSLLP